jgi:hypothetical protein
MTTVSADIASDIGVGVTELLFENEDSSSC